MQEKCTSEEVALGVFSVLPLHQGPAWWAPQDSNLDLSFTRGSNRKHHCRRTKVSLCEGNPTTAFSISGTSPDVGEVTVAITVASRRAPGPSRTAGLPANWALYTELRRRNRGRKTGAAFFVEREVTAYRHCPLSHYGTMACSQTPFERPTRLEPVTFRLGTERSTA